MPSVIFSSPEFAAMGERANQRYQDGNGRAAIEQFGKAVIGEKSWDDFAGDWLEAWFGDAAVIFESDFPALGTWNFGSADANRISQPVLNSLGEDSPEVFKNVWDAVAEWIPHAENQIVTDSSHTILQMNPSGAARYIVQHTERHPIAS